MCATLLTYEGRPVIEVAAHMGHGDPGSRRASTAHVFGYAAKQSELLLEDLDKRAAELAQLPVTPRMADTPDPEPRPRALGGFRSKRRGA